MAIKLVAADMDGTLLNSRKELPGDFLDWVKKHKEIKFVIASGRQYYTLEKDFMSVRDDLIFIAENGSIVCEKGQILYVNEMSKQDVESCLDRIKGMPEAKAILCGVKAGYICNPDEEQKQNADMYYTRLVVCDDLHRVMEEDRIMKFAIYFKEFRAEENFVHFQNLPPHLKAVVSGTSWIDIGNASAHKGNAILAIQEKYGICREESMAFGDYLNDYELLQACEESYCMANGHEDLKRIAKHIAKSNDEDGVMEVLRRL